MSHRHLLLFLYSSVSSSHYCLKRVCTYFNVDVIKYSSKIFLYMISTLISIWNLDIFRSVVPSFCVSSKLTDVDVVLLEYISVLYPLLLILITYIGIELHARNFSPVVALWKPFYKCFF